MKNKDLTQLLIDQQTKPRWHWVKANWLQICIWPPPRYDTKSLTSHILNCTNWPFSHFRHIQTKLQRDGRKRFHIFVPPSQIYQYLDTLSTIFPDSRVRPHQPYRVSRPPPPPQAQDNDFNLKCLTWNCRTLNSQSSITFLKHLMRKHDIDIVAVQETLRLPGSHPIFDTFEWTSLERSGSHTRHERGVILACKTGRNSKFEGWKFEDISPTTSQTRIFALLSPPIGVNQLPIIVSTVYMTAQASKREDWENLKSDLTAILQSHPTAEFICLGDFNMSARKTNQHLWTLTHRIKVVNFPENSIPTWSKGKVHKTIDLVISSRTLNTHISVEKQTLSDHQPVISTSHLKCALKPFKRRISPVKVIQHAESFRRHNFYSAIEHLQDPAPIWNQLKTDIINHADRTGVWTTRYIAKPPIISKLSLKILKAKRKAEKELRDNRNAENLQKVRDLSKDLHRSIRIDKSTKDIERMVNAVEPLQRNAHVIDSWAYTMNLFQTGKSVKSRRSGTTTIVKDHRSPQDEIDASSAKQSSIWLDHFSSICGPPSIAKHPASALDWKSRETEFANKVRQLDAEFGITPKPYAKPSTMLPPLDIGSIPQWDEIRKHIRRLGERKAPGEDQIISEIFKAEIMNTNEEGDLFSDFPKYPLGLSINHLIRQIWITQTVPDDLKLSIIAPIPKTTAPEFASDFRPISLIPVAMKLLTSIIAERILKEGNDRLSNAQAGFRTSEECISQIITLHDSIKILHEDNHTAHVAFLDLKQAFDSVPHHILFKSAEEFGIPNATLNIIKNIYVGSKAKVRLEDGKFTPEFDIKRGVKQGDPLSPILFIIFMDSLVRLLQQRDLSPTIKGIKVGELLYADDIALLSDSIEKLAQALKYSELWFQERFMEPNPKKCGIVTFTPPGQPKMPFQPLSFSNGEIPKVDNYKYLGVTFTESLNHQEMAAPRVKLGKHLIDMCTGKLRSNSIPTTLKRTIIRSIIIPTMTYGSQLWGMDKNATDLVNEQISRAVYLMASTASMTHMGQEIHGIPTMEELFLRNNVSLLMRAHKKRTIFRTLMSKILPIRDDQAPTIGTWAETAQNIIRTFSTFHDVPQGNARANQPGQHPYDYLLKLEDNGANFQEIENDLSKAIKNLKLSKFQKSSIFNRQFQGQRPQQHQKIDKMEEILHLCKTGINNLYPLTTGLRDVLNIISGTFYNGRRLRNIQTTMNRPAEHIPHELCIHCNSGHQETISHMIGSCQSWDRQRKIIWGKSKLGKAKLDPILKTLLKPAFDIENRHNLGLQVLRGNQPDREISFYEKHIQNIAANIHPFSKIAAFLQLIGPKRRKERKNIMLQSQQNMLAQLQQPQTQDPITHNTNDPQVRAMAQWLATAKVTDEVPTANR